MRTLSLALVLGFLPVYAEASFLRIDPREAFARTVAVLEHFKVPAEPESQPRVDELHGLQTLSGARELLRTMDPAGELERSYSTMTVEQGTPLLRVFQDAGSRRTGDYAVRLAPEGSELPASAIQSRLERAARTNPPSRPLAGLRIALDPGHMGSAIWDQRTGKRVIRGGQMLSEGVIALQTAMLLEQQLTELGAEVMLTRRGLKPVTDETWEGFDIGFWAREELLSSSQLPWFQALLERGPAGAGLFGAFEKDPNVRKIFGESSRNLLFIRRLELEARAQLIDAFRPDLTLIIHFDTGAPGFNSEDLAGFRNRAKAFVAGAFAPSELASREARRNFAKHLLDPAAREASVRLSRLVVRSLASGLRIDVDKGHNDQQVRVVEPGVLARNLALTRKLTGHAVTYLECMFYDDPVEFRKLVLTKHPLLIEGVNHPYSDRLAEVADAIREGVLAFVATY